LKDLQEFKAHLKNPNPSEAVVARQEEVVLDGINTILSRGQINIAAKAAVKAVHNAGGCT
jgi:hypothetical protein